MRRRIALAAMPVIVVAAATWVALAGPSTIEGRPAAASEYYTAPTVLERAVAECSGGEIRDDGDTLVLDMYAGSYGVGGAEYEDIMCFLGELDAPASVTTRMESTRALDGMQSWQWDDLEASWTYHPDDGLDIIITIVK